MKKMILLLLLAVATGSGAWAQKGMQGVGANVAMNLGDGLGVGASLKYQYNISNYVRIEPSVSYYAGSDDDGFYKSAILVNGHFFFSSPKAVRPYAFVGAGYGHWYDDDSYSGYYYDYNDYNDSYTERYFYEDNDRSKSTFIGNVGLGLDWRVSHQFSLQLEAGVMSHFDEIALKVNVGVAYNF